ncbi:hypothetical protein SMACR_08449 [Sordaria macrospora]|uniref:Uncharacterized protein n=1 Tax=Sordaria macrospora TaxID=5147 RepID=A0A8S8ZMI9_SORMA|nr:hypothetical protein SMACR_08449 [Sordaria macrospora]WPJ64252.1 hypothetical protein SMAC4_08449 [Sordaria macrospora]
MKESLNDHHRRFPSDQVPILIRAIVNPRLTHPFTPNKSPIVPESSNPNLKKNASPNTPHDSSHPWPHDPRLCRCPRNDHFCVHGFPHIQYLFLLLRRHLHVRIRLDRPSEHQRVHPRSTGQARRGKQQKQQQQQHDHAIRCCINEACLRDEGFRSAPLLSGRVRLVLDKDLWTRTVL